MMMKKYYAGIDLKSTRKSSNGKNIKEKQHHHKYEPLNHTTTDCETAQSTDHLFVVTEGDGDMVAINDPSFCRGCIMFKYCPKLSRWKVLSGVCIGIMSVVLILYMACVRGGEGENKSFINSGISSDLPSSVDPDSIPGDPVFNRIRYKHTNRRLPQCVIIGARKAGTRALLTFLNRHTDIMAAKDEVHYFDRDENYSLGTDWYRRQMPFSFPGQITIEKSPAYFHEEVVPGRMHSFNSSLKLLLIVRDPVERAISDYYQLYLKARSRGKNSKRFEDHVLDRDGDINSDYDVLQRSMYSKHIKRWLKFYGLRQIHIVHGEAFIKNPSEELQKVEKFLGLDNQLTSDKFFFNSTKGFYCFQQTAHDVKQQKCLGEDKGRTHPYVDPHVIKKLHRFFEKYNRRFYKVTGVDYGWDEADVGDMQDKYRQGVRHGTEQGEEQGEVQGEEQVEEQGQEHGEEQGEEQGGATEEVEEQTDGEDENRETGEMEVEEDVVEAEEEDGETDDMKEDEVTEEEEVGGVIEGNSRHSVRHGSTRRGQNVEEEEEEADGDLEEDVEETEQDGVTEQDETGDLEGNNDQN